MITGILDIRIKQAYRMFSDIMNIYSQQKYSITEIAWNSFWSFVLN